MSTFDPADYLTTGQVAEALHVSTETVRRWIAQGKVDALVTTGGRHLIHRDKVADLAPKPVQR